ncbi:MAG: ADP-ribosylglycohydrolase family protein [Defluviitaleaceae bacterium]|nr:ADP-ribosylglycohydrolase family protein [Defluviitaleaceae bacterium]
MASDVNKKIENVINAVTLGHQMGQWCERRSWGWFMGFFDQRLPDNALTDEANMAPLIENPVKITTPGWGPTGFADNMPYVYGLIKEYQKLGGMTPEAFRDFLLASRDRFLLQGVGRSCIELMSEGMNPRIAGLYAPSMVSGCWMNWAAGIYNVGYPNDAYEEAVSLCRALSGGDIVEMTGAWAAALSAALLPGASWDDAKNAMMSKLCKRNPKAYSLLIESLYIGRTAAQKHRRCLFLADDECLTNMLFEKSYINRINNMGLSWMQSCYAAAAVLEYAFVQGSDWEGIMKIGLHSAETRFCAMLCCGIYAAVSGKDLPELWSDSLKKVHLENRTEAIHLAQLAVESKIKREASIACEIRGLAGSGEIEESKLYDRMLAGFLAGTFANAMGSPVEDRDYTWIANEYGVVDRMLDIKRFEAEDDAAMALIWADTLIENGGRIFTEDLAESFKAKLIPEKFYYDSQHAYNLLTQGLPPHAIGHWNVVTGSALMGCNIIGMYHACDAQRAYSDAMELSYHYQRGFDVHAAGILCAATSEALRDGATVDSVINAAINAAPKALQHCFDELNGRGAQEHFRKMVKNVEGIIDVLTARQTIYDSFYAYNGQDPWEVIAYTLAIFKVAGGDVWQAALGGTNIGRDSDTIACQAALLSACMSGMKGVPEYMLSMYTESTLARYKNICRDVVALIRKKCDYAFNIAEMLKK